ncbi:MAG: ferritin family protein [Candidatus Methanosuratincola sp.]|nr:ferritin family protein [Candidatus Methanosuratincola sp.]
MINPLAPPAASAAFLTRFGLGTTRIPASITFNYKWNSGGLEDSRMLSKIPFEIKSLKKEDLEKEIIRVGIIAELDAINLYEQLAAMTDNSLLKKVFLDIAKEEKVHVGEFQELLMILDQEHSPSLEEGKEEVSALSKSKSSNK